VRADVHEIAGEYRNTDIQTRLAAAYTSLALEHHEAITDGFVPTYTGLGVVGDRSHLSLTDARPRVSRTLLDPIVGKVSASAPS
jgi:hypothetical protein